MVPQFALVKCPVFGHMTIRHMKLKSGTFGKGSVGVRRWKCLRSFDPNREEKLENALRKAQDLRRQYHEALDDARQLRSTEELEEDSEDLLDMCLQELETVLGVRSRDDIDEEENLKEVEILAKRIEEGLGLPDPPEGMYREERESLDSFLSHLEEDISHFKDLVEGRASGGVTKHELEKMNAEAPLILGEDVLEPSRPAPDIPDEAMRYYLLGERILFILRRGYRENSLAKGIDLLHNYGLLSGQLVLHDPWLVVTGPSRVQQYAKLFDMHSSRCAVCNLIADFPKPDEWKTKNRKIIADIVVTFRIPDWYERYRLQASHALHRSGGASRSLQGRKRIDLPDHVLPFKDANRNYIQWKNVFTNLQHGKRRDRWNMRNPSQHTTWQHVDPKQNLQLLPTAGIVTDADWLRTYCIDSASIEDEELSADAEDNNASIPSLDEMTPDDAERLLRAFFGEEFDNIAQSLPPKASENDSEILKYHEGELSIALSWVFDIDLQAEVVDNIGIFWGWGEGDVEDNDLPAFVAFICNLFSIYDEL